MICINFLNVFVSKRFKHNIYFLAIRCFGIEIQTIISPTIRQKAYSLTNCPGWVIVTDKTGTASRCR
jgi:hypothetical protein